MSTLADTLDSMSRQGDLYETLENGAVRCFACGHRCLIRKGRRGVCQVRFNKDGKLQVEEKRIVLFSYHNALPVSIIYSLTKAKK